MLTRLPRTAAPCAIRSLHKRILRHRAAGQHVRECGCRAGAIFRPFLAQLASVEASIPCHSHCTAKADIVIACDAPTLTACLNSPSLPPQAGRPRRPVLCARSACVLCHGSMAACTGTLWPRGVEFMSFDLMSFQMEAHCRRRGSEHGEGAGSAGPVLPGHKGRRHAVHQWAAWP
jgi:hypothetical protein